MKRGLHGDGFGLLFIFFLRFSTSALAGGVFRGIEKASGLLLAQLQLSLC